MPEKYNNYFGNTWRPLQNFQVNKDGLGCMRAKTFVERQLLQIQQGEQAGSAVQKDEASLANSLQIAVVHSRRPCCAGDPRDPSLGLDRDK